MAGLAVASKAAARDMCVGVFIIDIRHHISRSQQKKFSAWISSSSMVLLAGHMSTGATVRDQNGSRIATRT